MARSRANSRSPLRQPPLPTPGASIHNQLLDVGFDHGMRPLLLASLLCILALADWVRWRLHTPPTPVWSTIIATVALGWAFLAWRGTAKRTRQLRLGMLGEQVVGQMLERLRASGYEVFHDTRGAKHNIDHVLVGPTGVYVIETKALSNRPLGHRQLLLMGHPFAPMGER